MKKEPRKKNKVLMVLNRYYPMIGGAEQQARSLARFLHLNFDYNIEVITTDHKGDLKSSEILDGSRVRRITKSKNGMIFFYLKLFFLIIFKYRNTKIVHCHSISVTSFICSLAAKLTRKKCILKLSISGEISNLLNPLRIQGKIKAMMIRYALNNSTIVTLTQEGITELTEYNVRDHVLIPNGIDVNSLRNEVVNRVRPHDVRIYGFLGRFCEQKGIPELLTAFEKSASTTRLYLMGSSEHQPNSNIDKVIEEQSVRLGSRLHLMRSQNPPYTFYNQLSHFVSASKYEGLPNVVLEALTFGLPCLLSNIAPHIEISNECKSEFIKTYNNKEQLIELLNSMPFRTDRTSLLPDKYNMHNVAKSYDKLYKR